MATLTRTATFTGEEGPKQISFPTPAGNFGFLAGLSLTDNSGGAAIHVKDVVSAAGTTTANVVASDLIIGTATITVVDLP
jgi:hypothetical protein